MCVFPTRVGCSCDRRWDIGEKKIISDAIWPPAKPSNFIPVVTTFTPATPNLVQKKVTPPICFTIRAPMPHHSIMLKSSGAERVANFRCVSNSHDVSKTPSVTISSRNGLNPSSIRNISVYFYTVIFFLLGGNEAMRSCTQYTVELLGLPSPFAHHSLFFLAHLHLCLHCICYLHFPAELPNAHCSR